MATTSAISDNHQETLQAIIKSANGSGQYTVKQIQDALKLEKPSTAYARIRSLLMAFSGKTSAKGFKIQNATVPNGFPTLKTGTKGRGAMTPEEKAKHAEQTKNALLAQFSMLTANGEGEAPKKNKK